MMATLADVEASVRAGTDHDTDTQVTQAQVYAWANEVYLSTRRRLADLAPDLWTVVSADFTLPGGAQSQDLTASPLSLTDFGKLRIVEIKQGGFYYPIPVASFLGADARYDIGYRLRGTIIDLYPSTFVPGQTFRVKYVKKAAKLVNSGDAIDLPDGGETVVIESVNARIRVRMEEDPSYHVAAADAAYRALRDSIVRQYVSTPETVTDVSGQFDGGTRGYF